MFDIFYFGKKPNLFAHEKFADNLEEAGKLCRTKFYWYIYGGNDYSKFDFEFCPPPWEENQIHIWPNQWQKNGEVYFVPKSYQERIENYHDDIQVTRLPNLEYYDIPNNVDKHSIDWSWCPDPCSPPYIYVFGNQWNPAINDPTVTYTVPGATQCKFIEDKPVKLLPTLDNWEILDDIEEFDFSWRPDPTHPPYIYVFGNQWHSPETRPSVRYKVPNATQLKFVFDPVIKRKSIKEKFEFLADCEFDCSWEPDPGDPPFIYIFGNQHWPAEVMPTVKYKVDNATEVKYVQEPYAILSVTNFNWTSLIDLPFDFDRSWCPDPGDPPYIYQFGNQWYPAEVMPTIEYRVPGATEIKYVDGIQARLLPCMERWNIPEEIDSANIDFSWAPHPKDDPYIHHFGSDYQISTGLTYTVPGATEPKFEGEPPRLLLDKTAIAVVDIFFVDRYNTFSNDRYKKLCEKYPGIQKIRYANSMLETIKRCVTRSQTRKFWVISSLNIYDDFDFAWHAEPWQNYMTHVFPSQWNKWSDTFLINKYEFERHSRWAKGIEEFPNLNFVKNQTVQSASDGSNIYYVDHGNETDQLSVLQSRFVKIKTTRFVDNYLDTFKRIMATAETEYVWIISSICNYDAFDFTWHPEAWQSEMIHVFPSGMQRRGDTFYIHVESFKTQMYELEMLDWFNVINYCQDQTVYRLDPPVFYYEADSLVDPVKNTTFNYPYAVFKHSSEGVLPGPNYVYPCLWAAKDRVIEAITSNNCNSVVPRDARSIIQNQIYDYPYILKDRKNLHRNKPLDIIFISNGEPDEELMYHHTEYMSDSDVKWVRGVNGRVAAYQAAANASSTPWFFAVFAKLEVVGNTFPWYDWQPDYWQQPKHYIFNARNPVNGLEYGHQGMIAYNKKLVLENNTPGIDFTLSQPHESVPLLSGVARFNQDPWMTWRTAFREVIKLKHFTDTEPTVETEHRLETWLTKAEGDHAEWCLRGAHDALSYYNEVQGGYDLLMLSFEWAWLKQRFNILYTV